MTEGEKATQATNALIPFISKSQRLALKSLVKGEEGSFYVNKIIELGERIMNMPKSYDQDGKGEEATVYLHYFMGSCDVWITEKDMEDGVSQAFGWTDLGYGAELGYVSITEITEAGMELDFYFEPQTVAELKRKGAIK